MKNHKVDELANEIASDYQTEIIDPILIAQNERIVVAPGEFPKGFMGKLEFLREKNRFIIFYNSNTSIYSTVRIRFSIAHELGHYFLPEHRQLILENRFNNLGYGKHDLTNLIEKQANQFASTLLLPSRFLKEFLKSKPSFTMNDILDFANTKNTSLETTIIKVLEKTDQKVVLVVTENNKIVYTVHSPEAFHNGYIITKDQVLPFDCLARKLTKESLFGIKVYEHQISFEKWFPNKYSSAPLWEETIRLSQVSKTFTLLYID